jgi:hypothetical protein
MLLVNTNQMCSLSLGQHNCFNVSNISSLVWTISKKFSMRHVEVLKFAHVASDQCCIHHNKIQYQTTELMVNTVIGHYRGRLVPKYMTFYFVTPH